MMFLMRWIEVNIVDSPNELIDQWCLISVAPRYFRFISLSSAYTHTVLCRLVGLWSSWLIPLNFHESFIRCFVVDRAKKEFLIHFNAFQLFAASCFKFNFLQHSFQISNYYRCILFFHLLIEICWKPTT